MDGNGRWAKKRSWFRVKGHEQGAETVRTIVRASRKAGIKVLTLYAFSTENWQRPAKEIRALMHLLKKFLKTEENELLENNIRLCAIGELHRLPTDVFQVLDRVRNRTAENDGMRLNLALSYGARGEIVRMARSLAEKVRDGKISLQDINEETLSDHLYTAGLPDPDLLIRTSGEMRISNFLLWQIAYSELFITDTLWPDFTKEEYLAIIDAYRQRDRRFGETAPL
jgi:undecaprenyl diphosphate synthase